MEARPWVRAFRNCCQFPWCFSLAPSRSPAIKKDAGCIPDSLCHFPFPEARMGFAQDPRHGGLWRLTLRSVRRFFWCRWRGSWRFSHCVQSAQRSVCLHFRFDCAVHRCNSRIAVCLGRNTPGRKPALRTSRLHPDFLSWCLCLEEIAG